MCLSTKFRNIYRYTIVNIASKQLFTVVYIEQPDHNKLKIIGSISLSLFNIFAIYWPIIGINLSVNIPDK